VIASVAGGHTQAAADASALDYAVRHVRQLDRLDLTALVLADGAVVALVGVDLGVEVGIDDAVRLNSLIGRNTAQQQPQQLQMNVWPLATLLVRWTSPASSASRNS